MIFKIFSPKKLALLIQNFNQNYIFLAKMAKIDDNLDYNVDPRGGFFGC
jgi:hypothetical protein